MRSQLAFLLLVGSLAMDAQASAQSCELGRLIPCDARPGHGDRTQLAADGNLVVVGTPGDDSVDRSNPNCNSGAVYVWRRDGHVWSLEQKLTASDVPGPPAACNAGFGAAVAIKGNRLIVGAFDYFSLYYDRNAAHVFRRDGTTWVWEDSLVPDSTPIISTDRYGWAVAIACDIALVGAPGPGDAGAFEKGKVFVFRRAGTDWDEELTGPVQPTAPDAFEFGTYLAMDEDRFVGGAARTPGFPWTVTVT